MKKKVLNLVAIISLCMFFLVGCEEDVVSSLDGNKTSENKGWSVFMYLCGTDLESDKNGAASSNIDEILQASLNSNIKYYIQTGGTNNWEDSRINPEKSQRFIVENGDLLLVDEFELQNMGEEKTFEDFLRYGLENYSSDKNAVIIWNHGGGSMSGVAFDERFNFDSLKLSEMSEAFENVNSKFEFVGFDCCLMSTIETALTLKPYANYMIASEETEPSCGWDYTNFLNYISNNMNVTGKEVGKTICDSYYEKCKIYELDKMATLAVTDLSKLDSFSEKFDDLVEEIYSNIDSISESSFIYKAAGKSEQYGGGSKDEGYSNLIDLVDLLIRIKEKYPKADEMVNLINEAVVYKVKGEQRSKSSGISIYFPLTQDGDDVNEYQKLPISSSYKNLVKKSVSDYNDNINNNYIKLIDEPFINDDGEFQMTIDMDTIDYVENINFSLFSYIKDDEDHLLYLGTDGDINIDYDKGRVTDNFYGYWPTLNDYYINLNLIENTDDYYLYTVPIILNGKETNLRVAWICDENADEGFNGYYKILGTWDGINQENGMSSRELKPLRKGDVINIIQLYYNINTKEMTEMYSDDIVVDENTRIIESDLDTGDYLYNYNIEDIYNNEYSTEFACFTIGEDRSIYSSEF
ncbi:MAG: clostripain-related cysteine peptidase [Clostridium sp.]|nr:clostripain-related cysteine peptidase [Clostridium sp.]